MGRMCWVNNPVIRIYKRPGSFVSPYSVYLFKTRGTPPTKTLTFSTYQEAVLCAHTFYRDYEMIDKALR
jgi:hypothetical protein